MTRHEERELALIVLYQVDLVAARPAVAFARTVQILGLAVPEAELEYARHLVDGVLAHREELDRCLGEYAVGWTVARMAVVDRNLLRLALFELLYSSHVPVAVAVDEAVELAKVYGDTDSPRFANGILGAFVRDHPRTASLPLEGDEGKTKKPPEPLGPASTPAPGVGPGQTSS